MYALRRVSVKVLRPQSFTPCPYHQDTKTRSYTKWSKRESLLVRPIRCSNLDAGVFFFCHGWSRVFTEIRKNIDENLCKSVQSVAENPVPYGQHDFRQPPVPTSKHSTWLFFVPSCLRGSFERIAAQKNAFPPYRTASAGPGVRSHNTFFFAASRCRRTSISSGSPLSMACRSYVTGA